LFLERGVVVLERLVVLPELVEARGFDEHPRVGAGESGDGEHADRGGGDEDVRVVEGDGHLVDGAV
jgi:hypothetical protein